MPLLLFGEPGSLSNKVYWINKMLFGGVIGGFITFVAFFVHIYIKKLNGKVLFPFQGIAITSAFLFLSGLGLYFTFS